MIGKAQRIVRRLKREWRISLQQKMSNVNIVSFPKCGRTWLRVLVGRYISQAYHVNGIELLETHLLCEKAGLKIGLFSHDERNMNKPYHYSEMVLDMKKYEGKDIIFLIREPKDVMVSWYFQISKRRGDDAGTISEFIRNDGYGIRKYLTFLNNWYARRNEFKSFSLFSYEELHADPHMVLSKVLNALGVEQIDEKLLSETIEYGSFKNLKKLEASESFSSKVIRPKDKNDPNSYKVRSGKIGGYADHLNEEDILFLDTVIKEMACPILDRYLK